MGLLSRYCLLVVTMVVLLVPDALAQCTIDDTTDLCADDCTNCVTGDKVPNPENCRSYYVCEDNAGHYDLPFNCPDGEVFVFDDTVQDCVKRNSCEPCGTASCVYECPTVADDLPTTIPAFGDCSNYYRCETDNSITPMTCDASTPFFDGEDCQTDESRCCHCHPYCHTGELGIIADPLDCRKYYLCMADDEGKAPTITGTCDEGENYDSFLQDCSASAECNTQCTNVVGEDGCIEPFTCETTGFFARCPGQCTPDYYHCTEATGEYQDVQSCSGGTVFHPNTHNCVSEGSCP